MKMNQVNENTASVLEGAKPHCSRRGILFTFSRALIQLGICVCYMQILIDPGCYDSRNQEENKPGVMAPPFCSNSTHPPNTLLYINVFSRI